MNSSHHFDNVPASERRICVLAEAPGCGGGAAEQLAAVGADDCSAAPLAINVIADFVLAQRNLTARALSNLPTLPG